MATDGSQATIERLAHVLGRQRAEQLAEMGRGRVADYRGRPASALEPEIRWTGDNLFGKVKVSVVQDGVKAEQKVAAKTDEFFALHSRRKEKLAELGSGKDGKKLDKARRTQVEAEVEALDTEIEAATAEKNKAAKFLQSLYPSKHQPKQVFVACKDRAANLIGAQLALAEITRAQYRDRAEETVNRELFEKLRESMSDALATELAQGAAAYSEQYQLADPNVRDAAFIREQLEQTAGALGQFAKKMNELGQLRADWGKNTAELKKLTALARADEGRETGAEVSEAGASLVGGAAEANREAISLVETKLDQLGERGKVLGKEVDDLKKKAQWQLGVIREDMIRKESEKIESAVDAPSQEQGQGRGAEAAPVEAVAGPM